MSRVVDDRWLALLVLVILLSFAIYEYGPWR